MINRFLEEEKWNYYILVVPIAVFMTVFLIWAAFSEIDEVVRGEGKVIPSGQTKVLQHLEGGIISEILVKEGDNVVKGQILYKLKNEYFKAALKTKEIELMALEARALRIKTLIDEKRKLLFPRNYKKIIPDIIRNEMRIFNEEKKIIKNKVAIAKNQLRQKELKLNELQSKFENLSIELNLASENMKIQENLLRKKVVSRKNYLVELAKKQKIYTQIEEARSSIPIAKEEIREWKRKLSNVKSDLNAALFDENTDIQVEIKKLKESNKANIDRDIRKEVISPVNGVVNKLYFYTINGIVRPGDKIAEISPIDDTLMIETKIKTSDRAMIWKGQDVSIEITAYDFSRYGLLKGKVVRIAPDSTVDEVGNSYYITKIRANNYKFDDESPILMGMIANCNILTGKKSILQYLLKPLKDIKEKSLREH